MNPHRLRLKRVRKYYSILCYNDLKNMSKKIRNFCCLPVWTSFLPIMIFNGIKHKGKFNGTQKRELAWSRLFWQGSSPSHYKFIILCLSRVEWYIEFLVADKFILSHFHSSKEKKVSSPQFDFAKSCVPYLDKIVCNWLR